MLLSLLWTSADNSWAPPSHSLADNCQTTSLFPRIGLSCGTSLELSSREGGILFYTIVPPHSLGLQYEVCSLSVAIPVTAAAFCSVVTIRFFSTVSLYAAAWTSHRFLARPLLSVTQA